MTAIDQIADLCRHMEGITGTRVRFLEVGEEVAKAIAEELGAAGFNRDDVIDSLNGLGVIVADVRVRTLPAGPYGLRREDLN